MTAVVDRDAHDVGSAGHTRASAIPWRPSFGARLAITLLITIGVVGAAQYFLAARQLSARAHEQTAVGHASDARVLEKLAAESPDDPWPPVGELLGHIASRPGVVSVDLVGPNGEVVLSGSAGHSPDAPGTGHGSGAMETGAAEMEMEMEMEMPESAAPTAEHGGAAMPMSALDPSTRAVVDGVLAEGRRYAGDDPAADDGESLYAIPLDVAGDSYVLAVVKEAGLLEQQLADLRWVIVLTLLVGLPLGLPVFYLLGGRSLTARYSSAVRRSSRDGLTKLGNHRSFHEELQREVDVAVRHRRPLSLALIDLDHFKQANDRHGHRHGDAVLAHVGKIMLAGRPEDRGFRIGGDEFALILPATGHESATVPLERIRARIEHELPGVTASVGIAQFDPSADAESLLATADAVLYEAKATGRNSMVVAPPPIAATVFAA